MKRGLLRKVAKDYEPLLPSDWKRIGSEFMRRAGDWVQIIAFNPSRWADEYEPRCCFEFLKEPGPSTGGWGFHGLRHPKGVQRWITIKEHERALTSIFNDMVAQFRPPILQPLDPRGVAALIQTDLEYWPHAYALCVIAAERGDAPEARKYYEAYLDATTDKRYDWATEHRRELETCLALMKTPEQLRAHLTKIEQEKLRELKLTN
jgi:hypothetical protein